MASHWESHLRRRIWNGFTQKVDKIHRNWRWSNKRRLPYMQVRWIPFLLHAKNHRISLNELPAGTDTVRRVLYRLGHYMQFTHLFVIHPDVFDYERNHRSTSDTSGVPEESSRGD